MEMCINLQYLYTKSTVSGKQEITLPPGSVTSNNSHSVLHIQFQTVTERLFSVTHSYTQTAKYDTQIKSMDV